MGILVFLCSNGSTTCPTCHTILRRSVAKLFAFCMSHAHIPRGEKGKPIESAFLVVRVPSPLPNTRSRGMDMDGPLRPADREVITAARFLMSSQALLAPRFLIGLQGEDRCSERRRISQLETSYVLQLLDRRVQIVPLPLPIWVSGREMEGINNQQEHTWGSFSTIYSLYLGLYSLLSTKRLRCQCNQSASGPCSVISREKLDRKFVVSQLSRLRGAGIPFIKRERTSDGGSVDFLCNEFAPNCCRPSPPAIVRRRTRSKLWLAGYQLCVLVIFESR